MLVAFGLLLMVERTTQRRGSFHHMMGKKNFGPTGSDPKSATRAKVFGHMFGKRVDGASGVILDPDLLDEYLNDNLQSVSDFEYEKPFNNDDDNQAILDFLKAFDSKSDAENTDTFVDYGKTPDHLKKAASSQIDSSSYVRPAYGLNIDDGYLVQKEPLEDDNDDLLGRFELLPVIKVMFDLSFG